MRRIKVGPPTTRAVLFSLGALTTCDDADDFPALTFREIVTRFDIRGDAAEAFGLFCSRFSQAARWYQEQPVYRQSDMVHDALLAGLVALGAKPSEADLADLERVCEEKTLLRLHQRPGSTALLARLGGRGIRTALVANADSDYLGPMLSQTGLTDGFDAVICSEEVASCKPDPVIFYEALRRVGCRPSEALFVGSSPDLDVRGAELVGIRAVLIGRRGARWWERGEAGAALSIESVNEIEPLLFVASPVGPRRRRSPSSTTASSR